MTRMVSPGVLLIEEEPAQKCELCGAVEETRPYGPKLEQVCFACAMKDEVAAKRAFYKRIHPQ